MSDPLVEIPGYAGYFVSSCGEVFTTWAQPRRWGKRTAPLGVKMTANESGHLRVRIDGVAEYVHRLVLRAYVGPCPDGQEVRHLDGNPANNSVANLAYGTRSENIADMHGHGTARVGEKHHNARLSAEIVRSLRAEHAAGVATHELARRYGVHWVTAYDAIVGRTWRSVA